MRGKRPLVLLIFLLLTGVFGQVKREREESITDIIASNTMGFGNIWLRSALSTEAMNSGKANVEPYQAIGLGLSQNISAWAGAVPFEGGLKKVIGKADAHFKATLPYNDNLRLFGLAVQGDLILSTEMDTLSQGQDSSRPAFTPRLGLTVAADADLIRRFKNLPLKIYFNWSTIDNDRILALFTQQSYRLGVEYKDERNSYFLTMKYGRYKQITGDNAVDAKAVFDESIFMLLPGARYRVTDRFSLLGTAELAAGGTVKSHSSLTYPKYGFRLGLEFPLYFRETNAEAIRGMIFLENRKNVPAEQQAAVQAQKRKPDSIAGLLTQEDGKSAQDLSKTLKAEDIPLEREEQLKEKRKKINEELNNIEKLLE